MNGVTFRLADPDSPDDVCSIVAIVVDELDYGSLVAHQRRMGERVLDVRLGCRPWWFHLLGQVYKFGSRESKSFSTHKVTFTLKNVLSAKAIKFKVCAGFFCGRQGSNLLKNSLQKIV